MGPIKLAGHACHEDCDDPCPHAPPVADWELAYHIAPNDDGYIVGALGGGRHWAPKGLDVVKLRGDGGWRYRSFRPDTGDVIGEWVYRD